jgi:NAD-dependent SIR2 family protein deacetylase
MPESIVEGLARAAGAISRADALVITAGAGMGVDSGLPDFRGNEGFWAAYPPYALLGLDFASMANPRWFRTDPAMAWGFYGHRLELYRHTEPHDGFAILRGWAERRDAGAFVVTSNVDGHFARAGFDPRQIFEVHGSIHTMQCTRSCGVGIFPAGPFTLIVDEDTFRAREPLPACPRCGALARPNVLMFGDAGWDEGQSAEQRDRFEDWLRSLADDDRRPVIVECGAGRALPTIRRWSEQLARHAGGTLIRINPREFEVPEGGTNIALPMRARDALRAMDDLLRASAGA